jgi:hypothetical protein
LDYAPKQRQIIFTAFNHVPLYDEPPPVTQDDAAAAEMSARIAGWHNDTMGSLRSAQVPTLTLAQLRGKPMKRCPEVYLTGAEFVAATKMTKQQFYQLNKERQDEVRKGLYC